jgi:hypothetical protein
VAPNLLTRRSALKFAGVITLAAHGWRGYPARAAASPVHGYGTDPDLLKRTVTWPRTLDLSQLAMLTSLCDIVLPAEPPHPSAGAIGVQDFLDEWVSAPYPQMQSDRIVILNGLVAFDAQMHKDFGVPFQDADLSHQTQAFDRLCEDESTVGFSRRLIDQGHAAIGYVGNVALMNFPGPPPEVIRHFKNTLDALPPLPDH